MTSEFHGARVFPRPQHPTHPSPPTSSRGEETPLGWPSVSSHFGAYDCASFPKDRAFYYQSIFTDSPFIHVLPHWSFVPGAVVPPIWVYANAGEAEVFVNGASLGRKPVPLYSHAEWRNVTFAPGTLTAVSYSAPGNSTPAASVTVRTAGAPAGLRLSWHDVVGADGLVAGCSDVGLAKVEVVDGAGELVPDANNTVTFSLRGDAAHVVYIAGTASGDAASLVNNKATARPVFHGLALAVLVSDNSGGAVTVHASSPGLPDAAPLDLTVSVPAPGWSATWCKNGPRL